MKDDFQYLGVEFADRTNLGCHAATDFVSIESQLEAGSFEGDCLWVRVGDPQPNVQGRFEKRGFHRLQVDKGQVRRLKGALRSTTQEVR